MLKNIVWVLGAADGGQRNGVPANNITDSAAISACEKGGQWQMALQLMEDMQVKGFPAHTITYSAAISACEKGGQWQGALCV